LIVTTLGNAVKSAKRIVPVRVIVEQFRITRTAFKGGKQ
jgi:hypothetical protein